MTTATKKYLPDEAAALTAGAGGYPDVLMQNKRLNWTPLKYWGSRHQGSKVFPRWNI